MKLINNFILAIVATILSFIIIPLALLYALFYTWKSKSNILVFLEDILLKYAIGLDQIGNATCYIFLNNVFIKDITIHSFGNIDETISSVIGKNKLKNNLTISGIILDYILDLIDSNHSINSIE